MEPIIYHKEFPKDGLAKRHDEIFYDSLSERAELLPKFKDSSEHTRLPCPSFTRAPSCDHLRRRRPQSLPSRPTARW